MLLNKTELKIMQEFLNDYSKKIYGRWAAKKFNINQKTVSNILNKLEKEDILKFSREGKNKYYFLNKFNPNIKEIIKILELNKKIMFLEKHQKIRDLFSELEKRTNGILIVFGSYSKDQETKASDLDLFVLGNIKDIDELEDIYNIKINIVKSKKIDKDEILFKEIIKSHVLLKGVEEFIRIIKW